MVNLSLGSQQALSNQQLLALSLLLLLGFFNIVIVTTLLGRESE